MALLNTLFSYVSNTLFKNCRFFGVDTVGVVRVKKKARSKAGQSSLRTVLSLQLTHQPLIGVHNRPNTLPLFFCYVMVGPMFGASEPYCGCLRIRHELQGSYVYGFCNVIGRFPYRSAGIVMVDLSVLEVTFVDHGVISHDLDLVIEDPVVAEVGCLHAQQWQSRVWQRYVCIDA